MNYFLTIDEEVQSDLNLLQRSFENKSKRGILKFQASLREALDLILEHPHSRPVVGTHPEYAEVELRRVLLSGFSYALLYQVQESDRVVRVVGCYHTSSNPDSWFV